MNKTFYSNGKLLITGEYLVLDEAKAFALPTKMGQNLIIESLGEENLIQWKSFDYDQSVWFETTLKTNEIISNPLSIIENDVAGVLRKLLFEAHKLNPEVLPNKGFAVETHLTFPRFWGLGTSSTLINNVAQWFEIDAFELLRNSFGGSGYDIANAQNSTPITYQLLGDKPIVKQVIFNPDFTKNLYFLYLNQKQNSKAAIATYKSKKQDIQKVRMEIDAITNKIITVSDQFQFEDLLQKHETILSTVLEMEKVKERFFSDFKGTIKSLGAWGGDFVLVVSATNPKTYFEAKGYTTLLHYDEMIL